MDITIPFSLKKWAPVSTNIEIEPKARETTKSNFVNLSPAGDKTSKLSISKTRIICLRKKIFLARTSERTTRKSRREIFIGIPGNPPPEPMSIRDAPEDRYLEMVKESIKSLTIIS